MAAKIDLQAIYRQLMGLENLTHFPDDKALQLLAHLIDVSADLDRDDGNDKALAWCDELEKRPVTGTNIPLLDYFRANAWENRRRTKHRVVKVAWSWDQPETLHQILCLRRAMRRPEFDMLDSVRPPQIFTNLANQLNSLGRFVEAASIWSRALAVHPHFGMALGNRGLGLWEYARALYDTGHQGVFLLFAHRDLSAALSQEANYEGYAHADAKAAFSSRRATIETIVNIEELEKSLRLDGYSIGETEDERHYRRWVLAEGLFLNPLNDLGPYTISARDVFTLPNFTTSIDESPTLVGLFNQIKQEYVSARWILYDGINATGPHYSDRDVLLYNTFDYPSYSLAVEKLKAAYRIAYALFDKIAFFLNDYAKLKVSPKQVYFRTIWYENQDARKGAIRQELSLSQNWPLRGLFWLSKDLFDPNLQDVAEPDAQQLYVIRNCLEHSYLKVHELGVPEPQDNSWHDRLAYSVEREDFCKKTLRALRLARAAIIYLSLGMNAQERQRPASKGSGLTMPIPLDVWKDDWKL